MNLNRELLNSLKSVFGPDRVLASELDRIAYSYDGTREMFTPDAVVRPKAATEVQRLMRLCSEHRIPVVPRGAGSNLTGGTLPIRGGIVADFSLMNKMISVDAENLTAIVEPGVVVGVLQREVEKFGMFYPPDPASNEFSTIGGNIAEGAGGLRGLKYGVTRDYVLGLEAVLADGRLIGTGVSTMKSVVGYDLTRLLIGSEGTLAVITRATLKLIPLPQNVGTARIIFADDHEALKAASLIVAHRLFPRALEFVDHNCIAIIKEAGTQILAESDQAMLLVEFDGSKEVVAAELAKLEEIMKGKSLLFNSTVDSKERDELWTMRRSISPSVYKITPRKVSEDICVPRSMLSAALSGINEIGERYKLRTLTYGHAGDGNLHVNLLLQDTSPRSLNTAHMAVEDIFKLTVSLGGTISGEHGIGTTKRNYIDLEIKEGEMNLMRSIKNIFDPENLLNPGKIFPIPEEKYRFPGDQVSNT